LRFLPSENKDDEGSSSFADVAMLLGQIVGVIFLFIVTMLVLLIIYRSIRNMLFDEDEDGDE